MEAMREECESSELQERRSSAAREGRNTIGAHEADDNPPSQPARIREPQCGGGRYAEEYEGEANDHHPQ